MNPRPELDPAGADTTTTLAAVLSAARAELNLELPPPMRMARDEVTAGREVPGPVAAPGRAKHRNVVRLARAAGLVDAASPAVLRGPRRWATGLAACAGVMLLSLLVMLLMPAAQPPGQRDTGAQADITTPSGFLPLVPDAQLASASMRPTAAWLVSAEMPRDRLAALGLPFDPVRAGENVRTELLVNPAGEVLALRLLH